MRDRRKFIKMGVTGFFGLCLVENILGQSKTPITVDNKILSANYPAIEDELRYSVVNASHFDLEKVKALVSKRPELANSSWDWGFGDFETAIGACSHTGRRDIAELLISYGARPDIFTFAMLGMLRPLKHIIEATPGVQRNPGPHGITLLKHAQNRLASKNIDKKDKKNVSKVVNYLLKLGDADHRANSIELTMSDKSLFIGTYCYGDGDTESFNIAPYSSDPENFLRIARKGMPGRLLHKIADSTFSPTGAPSVKIVFEVVDMKCVSLMIHETDTVVKAIKIN